jgi:hypothetical protein
MVQPRRRAGLAQESIATGGVGGTSLIVVEQLHGDIAFEVVVNGPMDSCGTSRSHDFAQFVPVGEQSRHDVSWRTDQCAAGMARRSPGTSALRLGSWRLDRAADFMIDSAAA